MENRYNPMSKEFQDECKRLGLTGRQLTAKYRKEGKSLDKDKVYKTKRRKIYMYTKEEMLHSLRQLYEKYKRPLTQGDFTNNPGCPCLTAYKTRFGGIQNALKLVELDFESIAKKGILENNRQKARLAEIIVRDYFKVRPIDLAGENCNSLCDGICPSGMNYDVKSSGLHKTHYDFRTNNKYKEEIELYYLLAFNEDWTKLDYGWRIPGEIAEKDNLLVGTTYRAKFNVDNMREYDITDKLKDALKKYGFPREQKTI